MCLYLYQLIEVSHYIKYYMLLTMANLYVSPAIKQISNVETPGEVGCTIFIYLFTSARAIEWQPQCFATFLLHQAPVKITSVLVLFVTFRGLIQLSGVQVGLHRFPLAALVAYPAILRSTLLHRRYSQRLGGS